MAGTGCLVPRFAFELELLAALLSGLVSSGFIASYIFAQIYRYRFLSDPLQRQQTKWVVFGTAVALSGFLGSILLAGIYPLFARPSLFFRVRSRRRSTSLCC